MMQAEHNREAAPETNAGFNWQVRVYYEDTDSAGVVYHSNYLKYMERARTEWLRSAGYSQRTLLSEDGVVFVVSSMKLDFISPARFDDLLDIRCDIQSTSGSKIVFGQSIVDQQGVLKCRADVHIVCIDPEKFKPKRIPEEIKAKLNHDT